MKDVLDDAQGECGIDLATVTTRGTLALHLLQYRQRLLGKCGTAWKDVASETVASTVAITGALLVVPAMESVWEVRARKISDGSTPIVHVVPSNDQGFSLRPRLLLRAGSADLLNYATDWQGKFDELLLQGVPVLTLTSIAENIELAPNALLGDFFCRCLVLEAARFLAVTSDGLALGGSYAAERTVAEQRLVAQVRSHLRLQATRQ